MIWIYIRTGFIYSSIKETQSMACSSPWLVFLSKLLLCITYTYINLVVTSIACPETYYELGGLTKVHWYILIIDSNLVVKWSNSSLAMEKEVILVLVHIIFCWIFCEGMDSAKWYSCTPLVPKRTRGCYDYDNMYDT